MSSKRLVPPVWNLKQLRIAIEAAGVAMWSWNVDTDKIIMDEHAFSLWNVSTDEDVTFEVLSTHIHPHDLDRVRAAFAATRGILGAYEVDFRILIGDDVRWISARGKGDDAGIIEGIMSGIFLDVTQRKQAEEAHELIAGEMSHRVRNLLTIAAGLTAITSRSAKNTEDMALDLTRRLTALGRAHDLVRPVPLPGQKNQPEKAVLLGDLLTILLAPYDNIGAFSGRIRISVPKMGVGENAATTLALIVHELATNSLKHGALSSATGTLDVSCTLHDQDAVILWVERGGPPVTTPSKSMGYGISLVSRCMSGQFGGSIAFDWSKEGLITTLQMRRDRLTA